MSELRGVEPQPTYDHEPIAPPGTWDAACSCGALMRDSRRRAAAAALATHIEREVA